MMRGIEKTYSKPNMANLHGRMGAQILRRLRQQTVNDDNIRKEVEECKKKTVGGEVKYIIDFFRFFEDLLQIC